VTIEDIIRFLVGAMLSGVHWLLFRTLGAHERMRQPVPVLQPEGFQLWRGWRSHQEVLLGQMLQLREVLLALLLSTG
jgi:hypothetical protein